MTHSRTVTSTILADGQNLSSASTPAHDMSDSDRFDRAVTEYFHHRSLEADPYSFDAIVDNALESERLAQTILSLPAQSARQVIAKLSVLDAELLSDLDCEAPVERRHILAFAALKVDIVRLLAGADSHRGDGD